ncbi:hypothetical protein VNI00_006162 [Paramarasmius palmivorus]|uniref:F-box domain-containing protein n=1 Tax=Paramarasmius palmivorus TaxID=297713 RepID=A0AAW0D877_9AGAR
MPLLLRLQLVCHEWRENVCKRAFLWTYVNIGDLDNFALRFVKHQVEKSDDAFLHINLSKFCINLSMDTDYHDSPGINALLGARPRWKAVSIDLSHPSDLPRILFADVDNLPSLRRFEAKFSFSVTKELAITVFQCLSGCLQLRKLEWHGRINSEIADGPFIHSTLLTLFGTRLSTITGISMYFVLDSDFLGMLRACTNLTTINILALFIPNEGPPTSRTTNIVTLQRVTRLRIGGYNSDRALLLLYLSVPDATEVHFGGSYIDLEPLRQFLTRNSPIIREFNVVLPEDYRSDHINAVHDCIAITGKHLKRLGLLQSSSNAVAFPSTYNAKEAIVLPVLSTLTLKCEYHSGIMLHPPLLNRLLTPALTHLLVESAGPCLADITMFIGRSRCPLQFIQVSLHACDEHWLDPLLAATPYVEWGQFNRKQASKLVKRLSQHNSSTGYRFWKHLRHFRFLFDSEERSGDERPLAIDALARARPTVRIMEGYAFCNSVMEMDNAWF